MSEAALIPVLEHERRMLAHMQLPESPRNLTMAGRRVHAAGRLAELGAHLVEGIVRVRVVEYGDCELMTHGTVFAEIWLDAASDREWQASARRLMEMEEKAGGLRLSLGIRRATGLDRARAWLSWQWRRLV